MSFQLGKECKKIKIVAFGDSITEGGHVEFDQRWTTILQQCLSNKNSEIMTTVINSGVGGNTSREGLARIQKDVLDHNPDIVLVEFGGNDATIDESRAVGFDEFAANLQTIFHKISDINACVMLLTFPPIVDNWHAHGKHKKFVAAGGFDKYIEKYRQQTRQFAAENNLPLIDVDKYLRAEMKESSELIIQSDGVHLTVKGNQIFSEAVVCRIENLIKVLQ